MPLSLLFIIKSNPRQSHRPAEAIRIAVGLGTNKNPLTIILTGDAPLLLNYEKEELEEIDTIEQFFPILQEWEIPILVDQESLQGKSPIDSSLPVKFISQKQFSERLLQDDRVFIF